jgi:hypothetical protein
MERLQCRLCFLSAVFPDIFHCSSENQEETEEACRGTVLPLRFKVDYCFYSSSSSNNSICSVLNCELRFLLPCHFFLAF